MLDIEATYCTIPVWPPHKHFLVIVIDDNHFINHIFPFSLMTAGRVQGNVTDATINILHNLELGPIKKWVDNHLFFCFICRGGELLLDRSRLPFRYVHSLKEIYEHSHLLGVPS
jgi:hypothetical protein